MQVLFVCTGNICRSPIAERLASAYARSSALIDVQFSSAGTRAVINSPMHVNAATALRSHGGDPHGFTARQLSAKIASGSDLILTMTAGHRDRVLEVAPKMVRRTFTLREAVVLLKESTVETVADLASAWSRRTALAQGDIDIPDPIGQSLPAFDNVAREIATSVDGLIAWFSGQRR